MTDTDTDTDLDAEIRSMYAKLGTSLASYWPLFGQWASNSQYGYTLDWHASEADAQAHALAYYRQRMNLIRQKETKP